MIRVFLDTVGLLAIWDEADQWHAAAEVAMSELTACEFYTSDSVLLECGNASARKPYRSDVVELRSDLLAAGRLLAPSEIELQTAWSSYYQRQHGRAGIVDQISFIVMKRAGISKAFTNDEHYRAAGFLTLF
jgi:uncharacterized protein